MRGLRYLVVCGNPFCSEPETLYQQKSLFCMLASMGCVQHSLHVRACVHVCVVCIFVTMCVCTHFCDDVCFVCGPTRGALFNCIYYASEYVCM